MAGKSKDFDATELVKASESHEQQLKGLSDRVVLLENRVGNNEAFAKSFAESLGSQTTASNALATSFDNMIKTNSDTQASLRKFVRSDHIHNVIAFLKSFGGAAFWMIAGALISYFVPKIFGGS